MQVPEKLLENIENNNELIIKGSCPALLCTDNDVYKLHEMETTNTILLIKDI